jgi:hypothetical protein
MDLEDVFKARGKRRRRRKRHGGSDSCCIVDEVFDVGCFVATAAHGDATAPEVRVLRRYRDEVLRRSLAGRLFVRAYYGLGPYGARLIRGRPRAKAAVRFALRPAVRHARRKTS